MAKTPIKSAVDPDSSLVSAIASASDTLNRGLQQINDYVRAPDTADLGADSSDALARLLTKVAQVSGELRKAETAARNAAGELTPQQMLDRIRRMSPSERTQFLRTASGIDNDSTRSGLA